MPIDELKGQAQTVLGVVQPEELGPTMTHEHLLIDFLCMFTPPIEASERFKAFEPVTLRKLGWVRYNSFSNKDNLEVLDADTAVSEALLYKKAGGRTIVDATTIGIGRDPLALARIARATGLNIVMGAGYYVEASHPDDMDERTVDELTRQLIDEVTVGVDDTGVKAGIIGELGCMWPATENEQKVLVAAARAQQETGAAILIHTGRNPQAPFEILDVLAAAGADLGRVIMGHLDRTIFDVGELKELAQRGCYLEYDLFGLESSYYPLGDMDMPSDAQRLGFIRRLIDEGYAERIVVWHDIYSKHRLVSYGGHGYGHFLQNIVPRMRNKGFARKHIDAITVGNPRRVLTFAPPI